MYKINLLAAENIILIINNRYIWYAVLTHTKCAVFWYTTHRYSVRLFACRPSLKSKVRDF